MGARHLREFLRRASEATAATAGAAERQPEGAAEREVAAALRGMGYSVHTDVGCGGYRVDLAVVHPERPGEYVLGVECDGPHYRSAASARDRDRLRSEVLRGLGWRLHRVWSSDWAADREGQGGAPWRASAWCGRDRERRELWTTPVSEFAERLTARRPNPSGTRGGRG
ncbi:hypothetical protein [Archangium sp.]|uniref:hypothetical protein n=1 Tax=Archangium sp. TaxID=1872627 RepID=UPI00389B262B